MTDNEMVLLCAQVSEVWKEAHKWYPTMTLDPTFKGAEIRGDHVFLVPNNPMRQGPQVYDPLRDDAQAMALVKQFDLNIIRVARPAVHWLVTKEVGWGPQASGPDLSRAIVECVANLQQSKS